MVSLGLLVLRVVIGLTIAAHGAQKLLGWWGGPGMKNWTAGMARMRMRPPAAWAWISVLGEVLGGLGLATGFLIPLPNLAIAGAMLVAIALVHWPKGFWNGKGGYEFNLSILAAIAAIALARARRVLAGRAAAHPASRARDAHRRHDRGADRRGGRARHARAPAGDRAQAAGDLDRIRAFRI